MHLEVRGGALTIRFGLLVLHAHDVSELCPPKGRELGGGFRTLSLLALLLDERAALAREDGHVARRVPNGVDRLKLLREHSTTVEERGLEVVHHDVHR